MRNGPIDGDIMRRAKTISIGVVLALLSAFLALPANAQTPLFGPFIGPFLPQTVTSIGTCGASKQNNVYFVTGTSGNTSCSGSGTGEALCVCDSSAWRALTGAAATATLASTVTVADAAGDTTTFPAIVGSATGSLAVFTDPGLSYNATTNVLTVAGSVTANVTGALTGNADTATSATTATTATGVRELATAPAVCDGSTSLGQVYIDTTGPDFCWCSGAGGWVAADGSGTCA